MIKYIKDESTILAIIIKNDYSSEGIEFFTPDTFSQQLAYMRRPKDYVIMPHLHNEVKREVLFTKEVLIIKSGRVRVDFYDNDKSYLESTILSKGDVILLAHGGHGFEMLEDTEMIEVKQGPFAGEMDKVRFDPIDKSYLNLQ
jgi:hypothetical protein